MSAREEILSAIRSRQPVPGTAGVPPACGPEARDPGTADDLLTHFVQRAKTAAAQVRVLGGTEEIPTAIADALRSRNLPAIVHLPPDPLVDQISWTDVPGLSVVHEAPSADDVAVAIAPYAIAETGTLVYPASPSRPPSWHFRPAMEIALLAADDIDTDLENVLEKITKFAALPSTINLVTGPSRTGDIEQILELGAHGPKELVILIVPSLGRERG
jgi:L-lactate dehydrogenase complex protein LldG